MASNKRTRGLDLATRNTLSALESALSAMSDKQLRPDEFTRDQYIELMRQRGDARSFDALRNTLLMLTKSGVLKSRKVCVDGRECNAYSKA